MCLWSLPSSHSFEVTSMLGQGLVVDNNALNRSVVYCRAGRSSDGRDLPFYPTTFRVKLTLFGPLC